MNQDIVQLLPYLAMIPILLLCVVLGIYEGVPFYIWLPCLVLAIFFCRRFYLGFKNLSD